MREDSGRELVAKREERQFKENQTRKKEHAEKVSKWKDDLKQQYEPIVRQVMPKEDHLELFGKTTSYGSYNPRASRRRGWWDTIKRVAFKIRWYGPRKALLDPYYREEITTILRTRFF